MSFGGCIQHFNLSLIVEGVAADAFLWSFRLVMSPWDIRA